MSFAKLPEYPAAPPRPRRDPEIRRPVMIRIPHEMLRRIDAAAKKRGLSRAAFILSTTIEQLEKMEQRNLP